jgi:hypothetical protein
MFFINISNILRLIVTLSIIIFFRALYSFIWVRLMINFQTSSQSLIFQGGSAILCPTSRWSLALHLEFEGGCYIILCVHMYLVLHGLYVCISVLLAYIYRHLMYSIMCDSIYNLILNTKY